MYNARPHRALDLIGLKCPLPVLRTRKALTQMPAGAVLEVRASDPLTAVDIPNLLRETGDRLAGHSVAGGVFVFVIERTGR